jgi:hypothetical protein
MWKRESGDMLPVPFCLLFSGQLDYPQALSRNCPNPHVTRRVTYRARAVIRATTHTDCTIEHRFNIDSALYQKIPNRL